MPRVRVVQHPKENLAKCSVWPLRDRDDIEFATWPVALDADPVRKNPSNWVRLDMEGPLIGPSDRGRSLLIIDATWRLAERMTADYTRIEPRSLPRSLVTAYPRVSKLSEDPAGGLATVEALFAAYQMMGLSTDGLLDHYRWADAFLTRNTTLNG